MKQQALKMISDKNSKAIAKAVDVLNTEINGLESLRDSLDSNLDSAVEQIHAMKQNLI